VLFCAALNLNGQNCTNCDNTTTGIDTYSSAIGQNTSAMGFGSFASGYEVHSLGNFAFGHGKFINAEGDYSMVLGQYAETSAPSLSAMIIGSGGGSNYILENTISNSLMIGFNSSKPTFFVKGAIGNGFTGKIGIGDVSDPQAKLHIKGDDSEDADLLLEPGTNHYAKIKFDGTANRIEAKGMLDLTFHTASDFVFWDGNVGIGNYNPAEKLDVAGNIKSTGLVLNNGQQATGKILQSDATGLASWVDPLTLTVDDGDWAINGNDVYRLNGNVGIGTSTPSQKLDVIGTIKTTDLNLTDGNQANGRILQSDANGNAHWSDMPPLGDDDWTISGSNVYRLNGNVGIGTLSPGEKLDINGNLHVFDIIKGNVGGTSPKFTLRGSNNPNAAVIELWKGVNVNERSLKLITYQNDGNIEFRTNNTMRLEIKGLDEMIIGTPTANYNVKVNGKIDAHEVEVHVVDWWDNVFEKGYDLQSLSKVEDFIYKNGHLPDIPSEEEVQENGIGLGEMNALLLKKIEELTLYVIELEKKCSN